MLPLTFYSGERQTILLVNGRPPGHQRIKVCEAAVVVVVVGVGGGIVVALLVVLLHGVRIGRRRGGEVSKLLELLVLPPTNTH